MLSGGYPAEASSSFPPPASSRRWACSADGAGEVGVVGVKTGVKFAFCVTDAAADAAAAADADAAADAMVVEAVSEATMASRG